MDRSHIFELLRSSCERSPVAVQPPPLPGHVLVTQLPPPPLIEAIDGVVPVGVGRQKGCLSAKFSRPYAPRFVECPTDSLILGVRVDTEGTQQRAVEPWRGIPTICETSQ